MIIPRDFPLKKSFQVGRISSKALERSTIRRLEIKKVDIRHLGEGIFGDVHNLTVLETKIPVSDTKPFRNSKVKADRCS